MIAKDSREISGVEIEKELRESREGQVNLRLRKQTVQVEHPNRFRELRLEIARLETILREKKLASADS